MASIRTFPVNQAQSAHARWAAASTTRIIQVSVDDAGASAPITTVSISPWVRTKDQTTVVFQLNFTGTSFAATFEGSIDGGKTFYPITAEAGSTQVTASVSASGLYRFTAPLEFIRVNVTAATAASIEVWASASKT